VKREPISKGLRFDVFERDGFQCKYCGKAPPDVKLVVDHVVPVAEGGRSNKDNLVTSCPACNAGKAAKLINNAPSVVYQTDQDERRKAQETLEQRDLADLAVSAINHNLELRKKVDSFLEIIYGAGQGEKLVSAVVCLMMEFPAERVLDWITRAKSKKITVYRLPRYLTGLSRRCRSAGGRAI
jgi:hypothetical protein